MVSIFNLTPRYFKEHILSIGPDHLGYGYAIAMGASNNSDSVDFAVPTMGYKTFQR